MRVKCYERETRNGLFSLRIFEIPAKTKWCLVMIHTCAVVFQHVLADVWVSRMQDLGSNDQQYHCRTHLGLILKPGDIALG